MHHPSSKRCSACGAVKADLPLWQRTYRCEAACGMVLDRDLNASHHRAAVAAGVAGSGPETQNARGGDARPGVAGQTSGKPEADTEVKRLRSDRRLCLVTGGCTI